MHIGIFHPAVAVRRMRGSSPKRHELVPLQPFAKASGRSFKRFASQRQHSSI